ncbi:MAG: tRNA lysidine(34) synthetase TilS [Gammaproteobacteria bacterium]|nr:tRNA lysidine(34) synthetase TilS [Gammaproteobacteria bacterium]
MPEAYSAEHLLASLLRWAPAPRYCVAYSGGVDSHVLLHAACAIAERLPGTLAAIHIDHGIHPDSASWARHCEAVCGSLGVPLTLQRIDARPRSGASPESFARKLRYLALGKWLGRGEMLLTGHHLDDQAETLLLQLCRGAGPSGLSGMPALRPYGSGWLARPLLPFSRETIRQYARIHSLEWIDDTSNVDPRFDRNFLRREIIPRLVQRRPGLPAVLARAAAIQSRAAGLLAELAEEDFAGCRAGADNVLHLEQLALLSEARRNNLIHFWLKRLSLPLPAAAMLERIQEEVIGARMDAVPCLAWPGVEIRRYRGLLFAGPPLRTHDRRLVVSWRVDEPLQLADGMLTAQAGTGAGIRRLICPDDRLEVRFRQGGERLRPAGSTHTRELKHLFQERGIPPWLRERIPLLYSRGRLAAVADLWIDASCAAGAGEEAWRIAWSGAPASISAGAASVE